MATEKMTKYKIGQSKTGHEKLVQQKNGHV